MTVLGIETSCDETSAAVVVNGAVRSNVISSQLVHRRYGGVVPELASRAHQKLIVTIVREALTQAAVAQNDLDGVAATYGPGLVGALLVGLSYAKALAYGLKKPLVGINHLEAHLYSTLIDEPRPKFPYICLIVSGGHTQLVLVREMFIHELLGETVDDAAGEAYDKVGKMLGLGFPGGPAIDRLAKKGNPRFVEFPRSVVNGGSYDFSFSGVKTSVLYWLKRNGLAPEDSTLAELRPQLVADLCASFQESVVDVLVNRLTDVVRAFGVSDVAVAGGVSANSALRSRLQEMAGKEGCAVYFPRIEYCTDNGGMVAFLGELKLRAGITSGYDLNAAASISL